MADMMVVVRQGPRWILSWWLKQGRILAKIEVYEDKSSNEQIWEMSRAGTRFI